MNELLLANIDWQKMLMDKQDGGFLLEVMLRTIGIYIYTLLMVRMMGKRGMANLTPFEFAIIVALGSAVGDPMFYDDVPMIPAMLAIAIVVALQRTLARITLKSSKIEKLIESSPRRLVKNGVIDLKALEAERLSRDELFEYLRLDGVRQLGEVELAYLERSGKLSILRFDEPRPGLCCLPDEDSDKCTSGLCQDCGYADGKQSTPDNCAGCGGLWRT